MDVRFSSDDRRSLIHVQRASRYGASSRVRGERQVMDFRRRQELLEVEMGELEGSGHHVVSRSIQ